MERNDTILERVSLLKPEHVLDVGCGCGSFTAELSPHGGKIIAIDSSPALIDRCKIENQKPNITYVCMDARYITYPDAGFDLVMERDCLHHILEWEKVLDEMMRLSSKYVLIEEPMDDPRSDAKRNAIRAQRFYLEVQREVGFTHYLHLPLNSLLGYFRKRGRDIEIKIIKSDQPVDFDQFFSGFDKFAEKSNRKDYWYDRLNRLKQELSGMALGEEDRVFISVNKQI